MQQWCRVCGEPAAGFHFGAFTCEGCKSFFGRTCNNNYSFSDCKSGGKCVITKKNRTACKSCRLRQCIKAGMSKSGSRYGRRSNWFKIHCLLQDPEPSCKSPTSQNDMEDSSSDTKPEVTISRKDSTVHDISKLKHSDSTDTLTVTRKKMEKRHFNKKFSPFHHPYHRMKNVHTNSQQNQTFQYGVNSSSFGEPNYQNPGILSLINSIKSCQPPQESYNVHSNQDAEDTKNESPSINLLKLIETYNLMLEKISEHRHDQVEVRNEPIRRVPDLVCSKFRRKTEQSEPIDLSVAKDSDIDIETTDEGDKLDKNDNISGPTEHGSCSKKDDLTKHQNLTELRQEFTQNYLNALDLSKKILSANTVSDSHVLPYTWNRFGNATHFTNFNMLANSQTVDDRNSHTSFFNSGNAIPSLNRITSMEDSNAIS